MEHVQLAVSIIILRSSMQEGRADMEHVQLAVSIIILRSSIQEREELNMKYYDYSVYQQRKVA
jgi:hypothetical protein